LYDKSNARRRSNELIAAYNNNEGFGSQIGGNI
jgi:hypothetical protein